MNQSLTFQAYQRLSEENGFEIYQIRRQKTLLNSMSSANNLSLQGHSSFLLSGRLVAVSESCHLDS
jgi:hypothetical protein